jgi:hypothetical protein
MGYAYAKVMKIIPQEHTCWFPESTTTVIRIYLMHARTHTHTHTHTHEVYTHMRWTSFHRKYSF